jgi:uncharacterized protein (DUF433 family)
MSAPTLLGKGIYTPTLASRLTKVPAQSISRWCAGASDAHRRDRRRSPVFLSDYAFTGNRSLSFEDLTEIYLISGFRQKGISLQTIRAAQKRARTILGDNHPFSNNQFLTDGKSILLEIEEPESGPALLDLKNMQRSFQQVVRPYLSVVFDYTGESHRPARIHPYSKDATVIIDPDRQFGQPILKDEGIPTAALYRAYKAEQSKTAVAEWFGVSEDAVMKAVRFELDLIAKV